MASPKGQQEKPSAFSRISVSLIDDSTLNDLRDAPMADLNANEDRKMPFRADSRVGLPFVLITLQLVVQCLDKRLRGELPVLGHYSTFDWTVVGGVVGCSHEKVELLIT